MPATTSNANHSAVSAKTTKSKPTSKTASKATTRAATMTDSERVIAAYRRLEASFARRMSRTFSTLIEGVDAWDPVYRAEEKLIKEIRRASKGGSPSEACSFVADCGRIFIAFAEGDSFQSDRFFEELPMLFVTVAP